MTPETEATPETTADAARQRGGWRARWDSRVGRRVRAVAYWGTLAALVVVVVRRYTPDYDLPDLGPAPAFEHTALDGGTARLADAAGEVVVVNVWATWCPPCVIETPGFVDLAEEFEGDVRFFGISLDEDPAAVRAFAERHGVPYRLLVGPNRAGPPLDAPLLPTTYVIDRRGRVRMRHEGLLLEPALRPVLRRLVREPR